MAYQCLKRLKFVLARNNGWSEHKTKNGSLFFERQEQKGKEPPKCAPFEDSQATQAFISSAKITT